MSRRRDSGGQSGRLGPRVPRFTRPCWRGILSFLILWVSVVQEGVSPLLAQEYPNRRYTLDEGLPSEQIRDLAQGQDGRLWAATRSGVASYDGSRFRTYNLSQGLTWADQGNLAWDGDGDLWTVSSKAPARVFRLRGERFQEVAALSQGPSEAGDDSRAVAFVVLGGGTEAMPLVGTETAGLWLYHDDGWRPIGREEGLPSLQVTSLAASRDRWMVGTVSGLGELSAETFQVAPVVLQSPTPVVTGLAWDGDSNSLWILGDSWIGRRVGDRFFLEAESVEIPEPRSPRRIVADGKGGIFFANERALFYFHPALGLEAMGRWNGLPVNGARALLIDREDNLWVGSHRGLVKITTRRLANYTRRQGILGDEVTAVAETPSAMVLAHRGGLSFVQDGMVEPLPLMDLRRRRDPPAVLDLAVERGGAVWGAARSEGWFRRSEDGTLRWYREALDLAGGASAVFVDSAGRVLGGSDRGLFQWREGRFEPVDGFPRIPVRRISAGSAKEMLVATTLGIFRRSWTAGSTWQHFLCDEAACNSSFAVAERPGGGLWAGTSSGLFRTEGEALVRETEPYLDKPVYFILRDRAGQVWFGTDNGVHRWDGRNLEGFTVLDGLAGRETFRAAGLVDSRGDVWIGSERGVTVYSERLPAPERVAPILELTAVEVSGRLLPPDQPLRLDYGEDDLAFHYRVVSLTDEARVRLGYQLEGLEERQVALATSAREIRYPNLEPGTYRFRLAAGGLGDVWSPEVTTAEILIPRPIWRQPWFYVLAAGFLVLLAYGLQNHRAQRRYSQKLEAEVARRVAELDASEDRYRKIFERNRAAMLVLEGEGLEVTDANRAACLFYGYSSEEFRKLAHDDLLVPEEKTSLDRLSMDSRTHLMVERHRLKNGEIRDVETYASAILVEGRPTLFVIVHDVTERHLAEESIRIEKERLAITLRHIDDGVITTDRDGMILLLNHKAEEITGWSGERVMGRPLGEVLRLYRMESGGTRGEEMENPWESSQDGQLTSMLDPASEVMLETSEGEYRQLEVSGSPIRQIDGRISGFVLAFRDIGKRKEIEGELARTQKMEALGILAGGIAHDFNNLLTVLLGNLSLLGNHSVLDERQERNLRNAEIAVLRARDLAQQLLTFSKGGAPVLATASVREVVEESAAFVLRGSNVRSEVDLPEDLWVAEIDTGQINQVLNNLLINAIQAMPEGGIVTVRGENLEEAPAMLPAGRYLAIHISDQGAGIVEEHLDRIFDPYFTTKESGRGLGLSSAYSIVQQHEGLLTVQTSPGEGSTFSIYLPAIDSGLDVSKRPEAVKSPAGIGRVLVMDDDEGVRIVLESIVERLGYRPTAVADGRAAVEAYEGALETDPFDGVIMDLTIPGGMGGQETIAELLRIDPEVRAIVVSGYSNNPVLARYREHGFKGRVSKPFKADELARVLARVLRGSEERRP